MIKIVIIGSGNVAQHLIEAFQKAHLLNSEIELIQVFCRKPDNLKHLIQIDKITSDYKQITEADLYIIAVSDAAITSVSNQFPYKNKLLVHTSGSIAMDALNQNNRKGVFYPLQTFSKNKVVDFMTIPIIIESENAANLKILDTVAKSISNNVYCFNSNQRKSLHVAAVFANNFVNHLYQLASEICSDNNLPFEILKPLITETAQKIMLISPEEAQTGPAKRNDLITINNHINSLTNQNQKKIYELLTQSIIEHGKKL